MTLRCCNGVSYNLNGFLVVSHQCVFFGTTHIIPKPSTHPQGLQISSLIARGRPPHCSVIYNTRTPGPPTRPPKSVGNLLPSPFLSCIPLLLSGADDFLFAPACQITFKILFRFFITLYCLFLVVQVLKCLVVLCDFHNT